VKNLKEKKGLEQYRKLIDAVDLRIVALLHKRADSVKKIAQLKADTNSEIYDPARETKILKKIKSFKKGNFPASGIEAVYNEIFSVSRELQRMVRVSYLGPAFSFSHIAAIKRFGKSTSYLPVDSIKDVFLEVEKGNADYGVVPIENSTEGGVNYTYDTFADSELKIISEFLIKIDHCLLTNATGLDKIKTLYVHPQTRSQCRAYIETYLPKAVVKEVSSNSRAAQLASEDPGTAGIASELAGGEFGVKVFAKAVQDMTDNFTRFFVIGKNLCNPTGEDKTSIMVSIKDKPGALYRLLQPFDANHVNLSNIESRPSRKKAWDYYFFVDMEGHFSDANVKSALASVEREAGSVKILGSYPRL
jgi:chorismate mutase/prephenate dehydratase